MLIPKLLLLERARYGFAVWRKKRAVPEASRIAAYSKFTKKFRPGYATKVKASVNTTAARWAVLLLWASIVWVLLLAFLYSNFVEHVFANAALAFPTELFILKVVLGACTALAMLNPFGLFTINAPPQTALLMSNRLTRRLHAFGPGLHIKFPWEVVFQGPVSLKVTNHPMDVHILTKDRIDVIYRVYIGYGPELNLLPLYLRSTARQIKDKIEAGVHAKLEAEVAEQWSTELHNEEGTSRLEHLVNAYFAPESGQYGATITSVLGVRVEKILMSEPRFHAVRQ